MIQKININKLFMQLFVLNAQMEKYIILQVT